ncbi:MAG: hypothetical protein HKN91_05595 [Acidimicrobiia bacterium]|nr:hypothetical protein [Acidimicrobiia bacterium]
MAEVQSLTELIEELLTRLVTGRLAEGFEGLFRRGSAKGRVRVLRPPDDPDFPLLTVSLEVMKVPAQDPCRLYGRLLELNDGFEGRAGFCLTKNGMVCLESGRPLEELDAGELVDLIVWTADRADALDDVLLDEFGRDLAP